MGIFGLRAAGPRGASHPVIQVVAAAGEGDVTQGTRESEWNLIPFTRGVASTLEMFVSQ